MARFYGAVGYVEDTVTAPDVHKEIPIERMYKGELNKIYRRLENGEGVNDNVTIQNQISILADPYAINHMGAMRYVKWRGVAWKVSGVDASQYPRLILSLGGVYNGEIAE